MAYGVGLILSNLYYEGGGEICSSFRCARLLRGTRFKYPFHCYPWFICVPPDIWGLNISKILHDPGLRVYLPVLFRFCLTLHLACITASLQLPSPILLSLWQIYPDSYGCNKFSLFHIPLKLSKLRQCSCFQVVQALCFAQVQEDLQPLVGVLYNLCLK